MGNKPIHVLPERDRMIAETYRQNADGSSNPTGEAVPMEGPQVYVASFVNADPVEPVQDPGPVTKSIEIGQAETKVVTADQADNKAAPTKKTAAKKAPVKKAAAKKAAAPRKTAAAKSAQKQKG